MAYANGRLYRFDEEHVRAGEVAFEVRGDILLQDCRSKRTERLAEFDLEIEPRLGLRRAGIGKDTAGAQRAGTIFHAALDQADDKLTVEGLGNALGGVFVTMLRILCAYAVKVLFDAVD